METEAMMSVPGGVLLDLTAGDRLVEHIGGDGIQHLLLTVEVVVDGSPGQAAGFCDVLQGDMLIAVLQKQPLSGVQNGLFRHFRVLIPRHGLCLLIDT